MKNLFSWHCQSTLTAGGYENLNGELYFENSINNLPPANNSMGGEWAQIRSDRPIHFNKEPQSTGRQDIFAS